MRNLKDSLLDAEAKIILELSKEYSIRNFNFADKSPEDFYAFYKENVTKMLKVAKENFDSISNKIFDENYTM